MTAGGGRREENEVEILVVGSINADLNVRVARHPLPGETLHGSSRPMAPGGKGANQAVAAARLGSSVKMLGAVGADPQREVALSMLAESGVDVSGVRTMEDEPTGLAIVVVDDSGENNIIVIPGANHRVTPDVIASERETIESARVLVMQGEIPTESIDLTAQICTGRLVLNLAPVVEVARATLEKADPLIVNEHEGVLTLGQLGHPDARSLSPAEVVEELVQRGVPSVVMTLGPDGALVGQPGVPVEQVPSASVAVVDTTGAGDAFVGGFAHRLAAGDSLVDAASFGTRVGAFACTGWGTQPSYPGANDVLPSA